MTPASAQASSASVAVAAQTGRRKSALGAWAACCAPRHGATTRFMRVVTGCVDSERAEVPRTVGARVILGFRVEPILNFRPPVRATP
eukprot:82139-Prymnesium_polylepis.1